MELRGQCGFLNCVIVIKMEEHPTRITIKKINNIHVVPMKVGGSLDTRPVLGEELFPEVYANIFLCARKKSGKTVVIQHILKAVTGKTTGIIVFCSTVNKDDNWISIKRWAERKKVPLQIHTSIRDGKADALDVFMHYLEKQAAERELDDIEDEQEGKGKPMFDYEDDEQSGSDDGYEDDESDDDEKGPMIKGMFETETKIKKMFATKHRTSIKPEEKFQTPEYIIVLDDLSHELKLPSLVSLLKKNRHYRCKVILSSQYVHDLKPESIKQMDYLLLFKGMDDTKLQKILTDADLSVDFNELKEMYEKATEKPFGFLYIDVRNDAFKRNFNEMFGVERS
jgi:hypothetical protein